MSNIEFSPEEYELSSVTIRKGNITVTYHQGVEVFYKEGPDRVEFSVAYVGLGSNPNNKTFEKIDPRHISVELKHKDH